MQPAASSSSRGLHAGGRARLQRGLQPQTAHRHHHQQPRLSCRAAAQVQASTGSTLQQLLDWGAANKVAGLDKQVALADDVASGARILVAARDIGAGEQIFGVPEAAWITPARAQAHAVIGKHIAGLEPWLQLALLLLAERGGSTASSGLSTPAPYLAAAAPGSGSAHLESPLFWSEEELRQLAGTQLLESVRGYKQFFREQFEALEASLFAPQRAAFPAATFSREGFDWAVATVRSRLHAPLDSDPLGLVPLADALPHSRRANAAWRLKGGGLLARGQVLSVEAMRPIRKGEALAMDYGPERTDGSLLLDYGVLDAANAQAGYSLSLALPEGDRYFGDKADVLETRSGLKTTAPAFTIRAGQGPPDEMLGFVRLMQLQGSDCFLLEPIFEQEVWSFMCDPVSPDNEAAVCGAMVDGAREALAGYGSSIDEDLGLLRGGSLAPGSRAEVAVQVRLGEKEALDGLMAFFEGRGADLKALEYYQERRLKRLGLMDEDGNTTYDSFFRDGIA